MQETKMKTVANMSCLMLLALFLGIASIICGLLFSGSIQFNLGRSQWKQSWLSQKEHQVNSQKGDDDWLMQTENFRPNEFQACPYVSNGYFGQTLPAEGVGYWIQQNRSPGKKAWSINSQSLCSGQV